LTYGARPNGTNFRTSNAPRPNSPRPSTNEISKAQIFVAVFGASNYTFAEATAPQALPDWIGSQVRAFEFFQGVPELLLPDILRFSVTDAHRYEPEFNPTDLDMARQLYWHASDVQ